MNSIENILKRLRESRLNEAGVYSPYDHSSRDNSAEVDAMKSEEASHPYVGKVVRWKEDGRAHTVTAAFDADDGIHVRCDNITMKPDEYKIIKEGAGSGWDYWDMPKDYKGPWIQDHYSKDYGSNLMGFIYPPYEASRRWLEDESHDDYIAEIWDDRESDTIEVKRFNKMKDAREWLDGKIQELLTVEESYTVIDNTDTKNSGDSEKYRVNTKEEAEQRKQELIAQGSDEDKITIK